VQVSPGALADAREALARCEWEAARARLESLPTDGGAAEAERLDALGEALWWLGRIDECIDARQRAYELFDAAGERRRAGLTAIWLYEHHCFKGRPSMGSGWLQRARRSLTGDTDCAEWGHLLLREAEQAHGRGELSFALTNATSALGLGRTLASCDLEAEALQTIGRLLIDSGRPAEGLAHLDEAMLLVIEGRCGPYTSGKVYCSLVGACEDLGDLRRAAEWTDASVAWSQRHPFAVFPGLCRVKRAEVLQWRGDWEAAEREARRACEELAAIKLNSAAAAWVEVGEIRRRIGDLAGAEEAFGRAQEMCCTPAGGLARLRLAQGRIDEARSIIDDALRDETWNRLARARLLPAKVQIALAGGDADAARTAADELDGIATEFDSALLLAEAAVARGRVALAAGDLAEACSSLRRGFERWTELDVPYEAATAQLLLGHASGRLGDREGEERWLAGAAATFERLGAAYDARAGGEAARLPVLPCGLTEREAEVVRLVAEGLTNKDIAARLFLSEKTVARHLSNIFVKIGVGTRAAATAFAFERGIVAPRAR